MPSDLKTSDRMLGDPKNGLTDEQRQLRRKAIAAYLDAGCNASRAASVITDQMMEGMDGLELCELILDENPALPIVLLTAYQDFSLCRHAMREKLVRDVVPWTEFGEDPQRFSATILALARRTAPAEDRGIEG